MRATAQRVEDELNAIGKTLGDRQAATISQDGRRGFSAPNKVPSAHILHAAGAESEPEVLWDVTSLRAHLNWFTSTARAFNIGVNFGLKANNTDSVLNLLHDYVDGADAQSMGEVALAQRSHFRSITATGPAFSKEDASGLLAQGIRFDVDSEAQLPLETFQGQSIGVRARFELPDWLQNPGERPIRSRFGVPLTADGLLSWEAKGIEVERLRLHSSESDSLDVKSTLQLKVLWVNAIRKAMPSLREVNLGGGVLDLSRSKSRFELSLESLQESMQAMEDIRFWIEPGAALLLDHAWLATDVVAVDNDQVTIASSPWNIAPWLRPVAFVIRDNEAQPFSGNLYGPTCYENDMLSAVLPGNRTSVRPKVGDRILLSCFGAYTLVHARRFGEFPLPSQRFVGAGDVIQEAR